MYILNSIKLKDEYLASSLKTMLNIKEPNISFSKGVVSKEKINSLSATVLTLILKYPDPRCECCGFDSVIRHSYKKSII